MARKQQFYQGHYFIAFYDKADEELLYFFDNVSDICKFKGIEDNDDNKRRIRIALYYALRSENHFTTLLTGKSMRVYLIDIKGD